MSSLGYIHRCTLVTTTEQEPRFVLHSLVQFFIWILIHNRFGSTCALIRKSIYVTYCKAQYRSFWTRHSSDSSVKFIYIYRINAFSSLSSFFSSRLAFGLIHFLNFTTTTIWQIGVGIFPSLTVKTVDLILLSFLYLTSIY